MSAGKRVLVGFLSILTWPMLLVALLVTSANLVINDLSHVGDLAATVVNEVSANKTTLNSMIDEFAKSADPQMAKEIENNRTQIESAVASLGASADFKSTISTTLNQISEAALNGASSVTVDFSPIANLVAHKVNDSAKSTVITKKALANIEPTVIDLSKQSMTITNVKKGVRLGLLIWLIWLALLAGLFLLKGRRILRTYGIHFISVGVVGLAFRFGAPLLVYRAIKGSNGALYVEQIAPKILETLLSPVMTLSIVALILGIALIAVGRFVKNRPTLQTDRT